MERGSEGARERGSEGARERGSEGARERGSEGARERGMAGIVRLVAVTILCVAGAECTALAQTVDTSRGDQALRTILAPVAGQKACFSRTYDSTHLRRHPKQQVTAMAFELRYVQVPSAGIQQYVFAMSAKVRARSDTLYTSGVCETNVDATYPAGNLCAVDCDGGGVSIEKVPNADALYVHLQTPSGGIGMRPACAEEHGGKVGGGGIRLEPGADDKLFRLDSASPTVCQPLEQAVKLGGSSR